MSKEKFIVLVLLILALFFVYKDDVHAAQSETYTNSIILSESVYVSPGETVYETFVIDTKLTTPLNYGAIFLYRLPTASEYSTTNDFSVSGIVSSCDVRYSLLINGIEYPISYTGGWIRPTDMQYIFPDVVLRTYFSIEAMGNSVSSPGYVKYYSTDGTNILNFSYMYADTIPAYPNTTIIERLISFTALLGSIDGRFGELGSAIGNKLDAVQLALVNQLIDLRDTLNSALISILGQLRAISNNVDIKLSSFRDSIQGSINTLGTNIGLKLDEVIQAITKGYNNSDADDSKLELDGLLDDWSDAENEVIPGAIVDVSDYSPSSALNFGPELVSALTLVTSFSNAFFVASGDFTTAITVMFAIVFACALLGLLRFAGGRK